MFETRASAGTPGCPGPPVIRSSTPRGARTLSAAATASRSDPLVPPPWSSGTVSVEHVYPGAPGQGAFAASVGPPPADTVAAVAATHRTATKATATRCTAPWCRVAAGAGATERRLRSMKIGVLTGGGDCPGLNAVIRAVARRSWSRGHEVVGVREGWRGMVEQLFQPLGPREISGILTRGGTIIGTSRTNPYKVDGGVDAVKASFEHVDALVAIGGEDTLGVAARLHNELGVKVVGVPKTIDNDLAGTDYTFGFDTAVAICTEAIDRLHTTAESHNRVMVVEVMGRH